MKQTKQSMEQRIAQLEVQLHEQKYTHIKVPWQRIGMFLLCLIGLALVYGNSMLIINTWQILEIPEYLSMMKFQHMAICWILIGEAVLIALTIIQIKATIKGSYQDIRDVVSNIFGGLIYGLIGGLIGGLICGLIYGLIGGLIGGLIYGLIGGLVAGLFIGLFIGLNSGDDE